MATKKKTVPQYDGASIRGSGPVTKVTKKGPKGRDELRIVGSGGAEKGRATVEKARKEKKSKLDKLQDRIRSGLGVKAKAS